MNTLAGYELNPKNPKHAPPVAAVSIPTSLFPTDIANIIKNIETINVTPDANPSKPSVKLTAFTVPIITNIIIGTYKGPKFITISVNGTIICVALGDALY